MRLLVALLAFALTAVPAPAWDEGGHQIVDAIAYAHLNPKAKQAVDQLAAQIHSSYGAYDAITLGCWMDDIRNDPAVPEDRKFRSWHYIDIPLESSDPRPDFVPGTDNTIRGNAVQAFKRACVVLSGGIDPYVKDQAVALALVEHLAGDLHQPLHCATKYFAMRDERIDDRGGNREFVLNGPPGDTKFNLHAFWDSAWRASFNETTGNIVLDERFHGTSSLDAVKVRELAMSIDLHEQSSGRDQAQLAPVSVIGDESRAWAWEGNKIAHDFVYLGINFTDGDKYCRLSSAYVAHAQELARQRLALAGHRLAALLNATLGAPTPLAVPPSYPAGPPSL